MSLRTHSLFLVSGNERENSAMSGRRFHVSEDECPNSRESANFASTQLPMCMELLHEVKMHAKACA